MNEKEWKRRERHLRKKLTAGEHGDSGGLGYERERARKADNQFEAAMRRAIASGGEKPPAMGAIVDLRPRRAKGPWA